MLEFVAMTIKVMWYESTLIVEVLMLDQSNPHVLPQLCVPYFAFAFFFL
jgi:hypothetical protein